MILDKKNNYVKILIGILISMIFIYYAIKDFNLEKFNEVIINANYSLILFCSVLLIFSVYLRAIRWKILLNKKCSINFIF